MVCSTWLEAAKRKWIGLQPEVGNHLSLWYVLTDCLRAFLNTLSKFCQNQNVGDLRTKKIMNSWFSSTKVFCRWKTFAKGMVHRIIATIAVMTWRAMLVWQKTFQPDFDVDICCFKPVSVLAIWGKLRPFLLFLEITHPCRKHLYNDLNHFQSIIFAFNSASRSYCLRDWPLYHTRCCIRKKNWHLKTTTWALEATSVLSRLRFIIP